MTEWIIYLWKSSIAFTLLYIPFWFFKGDTLHKRNRYYLLVLPVIAALIPLIRITTEVSETQTGFTYLLQTISTTPQKMSQQLAQWSLLEWMGIFILVISLVILTIRLYQLYYVFTLIQRHKRNNPETNIIFLHGEKVCFSALGFIFISPDMNHPTVIGHENVHIHQKHTLDLIGYNLYTCVYWFNPFAWLALRSLKAQHEYEADKISIQSTGNKNEYQALLLSSALGCDIHALTHSFSSPTLKNRFRMMTKKQSSKWTTLKTLAMVPFAVLSIAAFSVACTTNDSPKTGDEKKKTNDGDMVMPEFPGGMEAFSNYLATNLKYPEAAAKDSVNGKVYVEFTVTNDGSIENVIVKRGIRKDCDDEAVRVITSMPKWKPATKNGKPAEASLTLPIHFKLN